MQGAVEPRDTFFKPFERNFSPRWVCAGLRLLFSCKRSSACFRILTKTPLNAFKASLGLLRLACGLLLGAFWTGDILQNFTVFVIFAILVLLNTFLM